MHSIWTNNTKTQRSDVWTRFAEKVITEDTGECRDDVAETESNDVATVTSMPRTAPTKPIIRDIEVEINNFSTNCSTVDVENASKPNSHPNLSAEDYLVFRIFDLGYKIILPLCLILGVSGNILNIIILRRSLSSSKSSMSIIMICLAVSDIVILIVCTPRYIIYYLFNDDYITHATVLCRIWKFINYTFSDLSCWLVMVIAFERSIAVGWPHKVNIWCSKPKTCLVIGSVVIFLSCVNSHFLMCYEVIPIISNHTEKSYKCSVQTGSWEYYSFFVFPWVDFAMFGVIPGLFVLSGNAFVLKQVYSAAKKRKHHLSQSVPEVAQNDEKEKYLVTRMTIVMFAISFFQILSVIPTIAWQFVYASLKDNDDLDSYVTIEVLGNYAMISFYFNTMINFVLYISCSQRFAEGFKSLFSCSGFRCTSLTRKLNSFSPSGTSRDININTIS
ncbi:unnamed protein product [Owenia fusiformis]|uniref:G-protein coupled receptors family 1 profile domain-containing protein n=1 Tax=Owenia fusiformis TaxID=6347 RepID=A0A8S4Q6M0_OWEFU|nr:unnamed protein product [Owenia fusiformis]